MFGKRNNKNPKRTVSWNIKHRKTVPTFHGSDRELKPEDVDFDRFSTNSDFGPAFYLGTEFEPAYERAMLRDDPVVNLYMFDNGSARADPELSFNDLDDVLDWINTVIDSYEGGYQGDEDYVIGKISDSSFGDVVAYYEYEADRMGITLHDLPDSVKLDLAKRLLAGTDSTQIAIRTQKGLKHLRFIDSVEVGEMQLDRDYVEPTHVASDVVRLMVDKYGMSENDAMMDFVASETFRQIMRDQGIARLPPEVLLERFERGMNRCIRKPILRDAHCR